MFPNNSLKSISPDVHMTQAFPNKFFFRLPVPTVGKPQIQMTDIWREGFPLSGLEAFCLSS